MALPLSTDPVAAKFYVDLNTGCVYELDPVSEVYTQTYCPPTVTGGGILLGDYRWETTRGAPAAGRAALAANPVVGVPNHLLVNELDRVGDDRTPYLSVIAGGDVVWVDDGAGVLFKAVVSGAPTDMGGYWSIPFVPGGTAEPADNATVSISLVAQTAGGGGGGPVIPPPPAKVTGLVLTPRADVMVDGTLRPSVLAQWDALSPTDLSRYDLEAAVALNTRPTGWTLEVVTGTATLPPGEYVVSVSLAGIDGGWSLAFQQQATLAAGQQLWVKHLADAVTPEFSVFANIYVGTITTLPRLAAATGLADYHITALPAPTAALEPDISTAIDWDDSFALATYLDRAVITDLQPNTWLVARVKGVDSYAQSGPWSDEVATTTVKDTEAPAQPTAFSVVGGYRLFGASWKQAPTPDLVYFQLRYRLVGEPAWEYRRIVGTFIVINGLELEGQYEVTVRAIDTSRNVEVSAGPPQVISTESDIEAGWVESVFVTLSSITPEDLAVDELFANYAHLINIDASQIVSGSLEMRADADSMGNIAIYAENGQLTGYWSPDGWYLIDPADPSHAIRGKDGTISFTEDASTPVWTTPEPLWGVAIGWWGINADYITTGSLDGGHNRLLNSGFEILPTGVIVSTSKVWTTTADFDGTIGTIINVDGVGNALVLVSYLP